MPEPLVLPRADHPISRRAIDPDALRVLYRLREAQHIAYLVGGSVRDLLLGRRPKDFDIGTSAHPYQVKRLFRNCWIIGRRFRLAHVKFGTKTIEVATFRRQVPAGSQEEPPLHGALPAAGTAAAGPPDSRPTSPLEASGAAGRTAGEDRRGPAASTLHVDNTFGTPEEDAFRRDFTVNALFYDIASFSIIDYVGGLRDLEERLIRSIGDPNLRFPEDPVRMLRGIALAARLDFTVDGEVDKAIKRHRALITQSAPARLLEELFKVLRAGAAERTFRGLVASGLLAHLSPELDRRADEPLWQSLAALDGYRAGAGPPEALTNAILLGSLLVPAGLFDAPRAGGDEGAQAAHAPRATLGRLPLARRDLDRLQQILLLQRRLLEPTLPLRARRALAHRSAFRDALTWLAIHGQAPERVRDWQAFLDSEAPESTPTAGPRRRRRRGRRRRRYPTPPAAQQD